MLDTPTSSLNIGHYTPRAMRCCGLTKQFKRCKRKDRKWYYPFCGDHFWQPGTLLIGIASVLIFVTDLAESLGLKKPIEYVKTAPVEVSVPDPAFQPIFSPNDTANFNVLIVRFEDYIAQADAYCIGRSIQDHLSVIQAEETLPLALSTHYVADSIPPPASLEEAVRIQKQHHADLIIYGLARNIQEGCSGAEICFRYNIAEKVVAQVAPTIEVKTTKHDQAYITTSPLKLEKGILKIDNLSLKRWISCLVSVKSNRSDEAFLELDKIANDSTLNDDERGNRFLAIGDTYQDLEQYKIAIKAYNEALSLRPNYTHVYHKRGDAYGHLKHYKRAIKDYDKAISLNPELAVLFFNRALTYFYLKQFERAKEDYSKTISLEPKYSV